MDNSGRPVVAVIGNKSDSFPGKRRIKLIEICCKEEGTYIVNVPSPTNIFADQSVSLQVFKMPALLSGSR